MERQAQIGSIISGTMEEEDLIPTFMDELECLDPKAAKRIEENPENAPYFSEGEDDVYTEDEYRDCMHWLIDELFEVLDEYAPPFCYFGAHPGDGADYGFWPSEEAFHDAIYDEEILVTEDYKSEIQFEDVKFPLDRYDYCLHVSDHGNMTLYSKNGNEIWSTV